VKPLGQRRYLCTIPFRTVRMTTTENTMASLAMSTLPSLNRWPGPDVVVESADGLHRYRECGVESPMSTLMRVARKSANGDACAVPLL